MAWRVHIEHRGYRDDFDLWIGRNLEDGEREVVTQFAMTTVPAGHMVDPIARPGGSSMHEFIQAIVTAAWEAGIRPAGYGDVKEAMAATKAHLEDMRKLVFETCNPRREHDQRLRS